MTTCTGQFVGMGVSSSQGPWFATEKELECTLWFRDEWVFVSGGAIQSCLWVTIGWTNCLINNNEGIVLVSLEKRIGLTELNVTEGRGMSGLSIIYIWMNVYKLAHCLVLTIRWWCEDGATRVYVMSSTSSCVVKPQRTFAMIVWNVAGSWWPSVWPSFLQHPVSMHTWRATSADTWTL